MNSIPLFRLAPIRFAGVPPWAGPLGAALITLVGFSQTLVAGAEDHWSYDSPQVPKLPQVRDTNVARNAIDNFILHNLEANRLQPSPPADKTTLIRRLFLDLTGLPPSPKDVDAFVQGEVGYEAYVNRLLDSPEHSERMATWWLDMARYADTSGYEGDGARSIWLYRDWVIHAFGQNMPFDQFSIEQLAGDLLPEPTIDQRIATGFHRNSPFCFEAGTDHEQFRVESVVDRVNTTMTVWMGTTFGCAQCHDHKYDPISQQEYYRLYAFFNDSADVSAKGDTIVATSPFDRDRIAHIPAQIERLKKQLNTPTPELAKAQSTWESQFSQDFAWSIVEPTKYASTEGATLTKLEDHSILVSGVNPEHDTYELQAVVLSQPIVALGLEAIKDDSLPTSGPGRYANGNFALSEFEVEVAPKNAPDSFRRIKFVSGVASYEEGSDKAAGAIDGQPGTNWCANMNEARAVFVADEPFGFDAGSRLRIRMRHDSKWDRHGVGRFRIWATTGSEPERWVSDNLPPPRTAQLLFRPSDQRTAKQQKELAAYFRSIAPELQPIRDQLATAEAELKKYQASTMVMVEREEPRETHVLIRGDFLNPGEKVSAGVPAAWHPWNDKEPLSRLGLARWLMHPDNPLVGRVTMNRIWAMFFGHGLVETSEDFGVQGSGPTHPKLLDFLATEFVARHWDLNAMQKMVVMSSTYRQSSNVTPELHEHDRFNRQYARGPAVRLGAEMIRDNALTISGLLSRRVGGPGVYPYQPPGVFEQIHSFQTKWETSTEGDQFRRAMYTYWKRTAPYPSMITFDASRRNVCVERRPRTNTPLQALVTLNDPAFVQCAAALARRIALESDGDVRDKATYGFRLCLARQPKPAEVEQLIELFEQNRAVYRNDAEAAKKVAVSGLSTPLPATLDVADLAAWTIVGNALLNLDETITKY